VEHHFSPYAMVTDPLQYLTYWAARTERIGMGTMVVVMPWHHPLRVAEQMVMLQYMLGDRDLMVGFGRGAARREYGGFDIPQGESRRRFDEGVSILRTALTQERFNIQGEFFRVPDVSQRPQSPHLSLRPQPRDGQRLVDALHAAWGSPQSAPILARLGLRPLIIPQRGFPDYEKELDSFYAVTAEAGYAPVRPTVALWAYCGPDRGVVNQANIGNASLGNVNYEFLDGYHTQVPGYEHYGERFKETRELRERMIKGEIPEGDETPYDAMPQGTPEECIQKIQAINDVLHPRQWLFDFKFGGMPYAEAESSIRLFAKEVLPFVHSLPEPEVPQVRSVAKARA
jgi:alkanesulfonate monooxygenase SsuD/methylene tetrahydromethanopterin reductase-like flavin-dependent oxidoreductase (luciferase family)